MKTHALHFAFLLFFLPFSGVALATTVNCGTFRTSDFYTKIPYLDVTSVYNAKAGQVIINVVNRHKDQALETDVRSVVGAFKGSARLAQILSDDVENKPYSDAARDSYAPKVSEVAVNEATIHYAFRAHSFTQIVVGVDR